MEGGSTKLGTTLSAGVISNVSSPSLSRSGGSESAPKIVSFTQHHEENITASPDRNVVGSIEGTAKQSKESAHVNADNIPHSELGEVSQESSEQIEIRSKKEFADNLFETAKKDGVDAAFQKLADGELQDATNFHSDEKSQHENESKNENEAVEEESPAQVEEELGSRKSEFTLPIEMQVRQLESQIGKLIEQNKDLAKKADEAQAMAKAGITTALELAQTLKALIESEEEEKKKEHIGLLEVLARLIAQMLIMMTVPENQQDEIIKKINEKGGEAQAQAA